MGLECQGSLLSDMCPGKHGDPRNFCEISKFIHFKTGAFEEIKLHHPEHLLQYVICSFSEQFVAFAFRCRERTPLRLKLPGGHHPHSTQLCVCIVIIMMSCVSWCHDVMCVSALRESRFSRILENFFEISLLDLDLESFLFHFHFSISISSHFHFTFISRKEWKGQKFHPFSREKKSEILHQVSWKI